MEKSVAYNSCLETNALEGIFSFSVSSKLGLSDSYFLVV